VLFNLEGLLISFSNLTGLHVIFENSLLVSINLTDQRALHLANTFGCKVGATPFTYSGLPLALGTAKPTLQDFTPLLSTIEGRMVGISKFSSYHGRLILVNSVFSALPTFYKCNLQLHLSPNHQANRQIP
jgi:hypothetical protein